MSTDPASGAVPAHWKILPFICCSVAVVSLMLGKGLSAAAGLSIVWPAFEFAILMAAVFAAVYHAEEVAHALGEPFGTLVLTMAVTIIECALILTIMLSGDGNATLARDTTMAVVMLILNLIIGLCILIGGFRYGEQGFRAPGARSYLTVLIPFCVVTLVLPNYTNSTPGPYFAPMQVGFVSAATLALYAAFLYVQTVRHREYFVAEAGAGAEPGGEENDAHAIGQGRLLAHVGLMVLSLIAIVLLSKSFSVVVGKVVEAVGAPKAVIGLVVALLVLLPESLAAIGAARRDQMQTAINLALGSSLATIGLTIPAVGILSLWLGTEIALGLDQAQSVLLILTLAVSMLTFGSGRTNVLPGFVHLTLMAIFVFLTFVP